MKKTAEHQQSFFRLSFLVLTVLLITYKAKSRLAFAGYQNIFYKHGFRSDPQAILTIKCLIDNQGFQRFTMPGFPQNLIIVSFIMSVNAGSNTLSLRTHATSSATVLCPVLFPSSTPQRLQHRYQSGWSVPLLPT